MGLVARRAHALPHETWPNMYAAAVERFWDAVTLACSDTGREAGAIYLLGYSAEALLKTAYCQFNALPIGSNTYTFLKSTKTSLHSLTDLFNMLIDARFSAGNSNKMKAAVAGEALIYVATIELHWQVNMRYYDFPATLDEANEMLRSVEGLFAIYPDLWS